MIKKFTLRNFKPFTDITMPLSPITVLGGDNSIGKTSILEGLFLFFDRRSADMLVKQYAWRGISKVFLAADRFFSQSFHDFDDTKSIEALILTDEGDECLRFTLEKAGKGHVRVDEAGDDVLRIRTDDKRAIDVKIIIEHRAAGKEFVSELLVSPTGLSLNDITSDSRPSKPAVFMGPRTRPSVSEDADRFGELDATNNTDSAVRFLQAFDSRIKSISSISTGDSSVLHADVGLSRKIPIPFLGDGIALMLSIFLGVTKAKGGLLLVDEIGAYVHHSHLATFWRELARVRSEYNCQIVSTTHSYECLEAAAAGLKGLFEPDFSFVRLDRDKQAKVVAKHFPFSVFEASIEANREMR